MKTEGGDTQIELQLTDLPKELLLQIFDYLSPTTLFFAVKPVCKSFSDLLADDMYFKCRFKKKHMNNRVQSPFMEAYGLYSGEEKGNNINWSEIAVRADLRDSMCKNKDLIEFRTMSEPHMATVDTVKLLQGGRLCATGGRDKLLCIWDVLDLAQPVAVQPEAQSGWIWDIAGHSEDSFYSCGWETTIKEWSVEKNLACTRKFKTERAAMRLASAPGMLLAGLQNGKVFLIDPREKDTSFSCWYKAHRGAITGLKLWNNSVLSVGEDRRIVAYDLRNKAKHFQEVFKGSCPRCTAIYGNLWYLGDAQGNLNVYDASALFKPIYSTSLSERCAINAIHPSLEGIIIGTSNGKLSFLSTIKPLEVQMDIVYCGEITSIDCKMGIIACGTTNSSMSFQILKLRNELYTP